MIVGFLLAGWLGTASLGFVAAFILTCGFPGAYQSKWEVIKLGLTCLAWPVLLPYALARATLDPTWHE